MQHALMHARFKRSVLNYREETARSRAAFDILAAFSLGGWLIFLEFAQEVLLYL